MKQEYPIYIVIVEDDEIIRDGFVELLNSSEKFNCIGNYDNCEEAIKNLDQDSPDVILMDIELPGISGIEGIARIKKLKKDIDIITVSVHDDDDRVFKALCAGASGYLTKNITPEKLMDSIEEACRGGAPMSTNIARLVVHSFQRNTDSPLSPRETEVLQLLAKGKSYTMIAGELFIDKETVRSHIKNIYIKLEVNSKSQAIEKATKERLI
ncbi:MAG: response regulator transcription factor [Ignavibacteriaceae bacterium]